MVSIASLQYARRAPVSHSFQMTRKSYTLDDLEVIMKQLSNVLLNKTEKFQIKIQTVGEKTA